MRVKPGNTVRLTATLTQVTAGLVDPATISLYVWATGTALPAPVTPTHDGLGVFHYDYALAAACATGIWNYRFVSAGGTPDATALGEDVFYVVPLET